MSRKPSRNTMFGRVVEAVKPLWIASRPNCFDLTVAGQIRDHRDGLHWTQLTYVSAPAGRCLLVAPQIAVLPTASGDSVTGPLHEISQAHAYVKVIPDLADRVVRAQACIPCPQNQDDLASSVRDLFGDFKAMLNNERLWTVLDRSGAHRCVIPCPEWGAA